MEKCHIDEGILKYNNEQGKQTTLFDYIDHQSVLELQKFADDEIGEIEVKKKRTKKIKFKR